jgi:hypothetical protein
MRLIKKHKILIPKENFYRKLVTYTIAENAENCEMHYLMPAGNIGNYEDCSFSSKGLGPIWATNTQSAIRERFEFVQGDEIKIEVTFKALESKI